jgi:signal transduction histidine kinase
LREPAIDAGDSVPLELVRRIVRAHGGTVQLESVVGQGTVVTVHLPAPASFSGAPGA